MAKRNNNGPMDEVTTTNGTNGTSTARAEAQPTQGPSADQTAPRKPVLELRMPIRDGRLQFDVWQNGAEANVWYGCTLSRVYRAPDGKLARTATMRPRDLESLSQLIDEAKVVMHQRLGQQIEHGGVQVRVNGQEQPKLAEPPRQQTQDTALAHDTVLEPATRAATRPR